MYSILIFATIGAIIGFRKGVALARSRAVVRPPIWLATIGIALAGAVLGLFVSTAIDSTLPERAVVVAPVQLAPFQTAEGLHGIFIFNSGTNSTGFIYHFRSVTQNGGSEPHHIDKGNVHIIEDPSLKGIGYLSIISKVAYKPEGFNIWSFGCACENKTTVLEQDLRVPVGSVVQQFEIE